jgi:hypothetical protein
LAKASGLKRSEKAKTKAGGKVGKLFHRVIGAPGVLGVPEFLTGEGGKWFLEATIHNRMNEQMDRRADPGGPLLHSDFSASVVIARAA